MRTMKRVSETFLGAFEHEAEADGGAALIYGARGAAAGDDLVGAEGSEIAAASDAIVAEIEAGRSSVFA